MTLFILDDQTDSSFIFLPCPSRYNELKAFPFQFIMVKLEITSQLN
jgi:hypothetical protein